MFKKTRIRKEIDNLVDQMEVLTPESAEYRRCAESLEILTKSLEHQSNASAKLRDTLIVSTTNLAGIVVIANYEKLGVWTTKAFSHVIKR